MIDIKEGQRFGKLVVLDLSSDYKSPSGRTYERYLCRCDCGNQKIILKRSLISSETNSCGCLRKSRFRLDKTKYKNNKIVIRKDLPKQYVSRVRLGAKRRGIEFNLTYEYLQNLFDRQKGKCKLSGRDINFNSNSSGNGQLASLDRKDPKIGYVEGNVQWLHKIVNMMKQQKTNEEFLLMCQKVAENN